jgi:hypothetical protein
LFINKPIIMIMVLLINTSQLILDNNKQKCGI